MRSGILTGLIVVALCACVTTAEQPAQVSPGDIFIMAVGDPNVPVPPAGEDPNKVWDPAEHLVANWESVSVSMTSQLYNPDLRPNAVAQGPQWSLSVVSIVDIIDPNGLIGWSSSPTSVRAFDQDGDLVSSGLDSPSMVRWYRQPMSLTMPAGFPGDMFVDRFSLRAPIDPDAIYPEVLARVEWTLNLLVSEEVMTVDIPFEASETWVELTPGMEILVEQADVEEGKYEYRISVRYDRTKADYLMGGSIHLWHDDVPPAVAVLGMDLLNAEGKPIRGSGGGSFSSSSTGTGSGDQTTRTTSGRGTCPACGTAAIIRYTLVFNMYELEVPFVLENIPVPEF